MEGNDVRRSSASDGKKQAARIMNAQSPAVGLEGVEQLIGREQYGLAVREGFQLSLDIFSIKFRRNLSQSETYREFLASCLSPFTTVDPAFLVMERTAAVRFVNLLSWDSGTAREEFESIRSIARLYFEFYEPVVFGSDGVSDPQRLKMLVRQACNGLSVPG